MHPQATKKLIQAIGEDQVSSTEADRYRASMDNLRLSRLPEVVIKPRDEDDISAVLSLANEYRIPVTARGAGSATTGATSPEKDGWVIDMSGWKNLHIDPLGQMAYVQPGVTIAEIDNAAKEHGLFFPPDPGSQKYATIGGAIATNAGGLRGAKYGVIRDYVFAIEGLLPTGEFVRWGADLKKYVSGFNVRDLWIGSEGMLGIVTGAVLKLIPRPAANGVILAAFATDHQALDAVQIILEKRLCPSILEFLDSQTIASTAKFWKEKSPQKIAALPAPIQSTLNAEPYPAMLLIEVDGDASRVEQQLQVLQQVMEQDCRQSVASQDAELSEILWTLRRGCSQSMFQWGPDKLNEDIVIPLAAQKDLIDYTLELRDRTGLATPTFGHAADGNFHVHIMYDRNDAKACQTARESILELMHKVVEWGGAITGEHGIGLAKSPFLGLQHSPAEIQAMQAIKKALDPNNILNPDKMFTQTEVWDYPRENVRMPWDH